MPVEWKNATTVPGTLYVEGITNSAAARDERSRSLSPGFGPPRSLSPGAHPASNDPDVNLDDYKGKVAVIKVEIQQTETNFCWKSASAAVNLTPDSYWAPEVGGSLIWTNTPAGLGNVEISADYRTFSFCPSNSVPGLYEVKAWSSLLPDCQDACTVRILLIEMMAYRPQTETKGYGNPFQRTAVPADEKESPGVGIRVNGDDDNNNGIPDRNDMTVNNENDLIEVVLNAAPPATSGGFTYVLKRSSSNIKVWNSATKGTALLDANDETSLTFGTTPMTIWVENPNGGTADLELQAKTDSGMVVCSDKIHFYPFTSIVIALGGENQVPTDPANVNHGIFQLAIDLYQQGYDVHMYDEDNVGNNGAGSVFDEIVRAIQRRSVLQVAIYGYSHGGGSTHDLSARLDNNRGSIGTFTNAFTAYIDAVENDSDTDMDQEHRRPPGTGYHMNYYQEGTIRDGWLDGGPIDPPGADYENNVDVPTPTHTHFTIDDDVNILDGIEAQLTSRVTK